MDQLFHAFGRTTAAPDAWVLGATGEANEAIGQFARVAIDGKFGIAMTQDNAASVKKM